MLALDHRDVHRLAIALIACALAVPLAGAAVVESGLFNVGASRPHDPVIYWLTKTAMVRSVQREAAGAPPQPRVTADQVRVGFRIYDTRCAMRHGAPGLAH